jgi:CRP-like cAMP-binding protein
VTAMKLSSLSEYPELSHFTEEQLGALATCIRRIQLPTNSVILTNGETGREAFFVQKGTVELRRDTAYGPFVLVALGPGQIFGEMSFLDGAPRSLNVVATSDVELIAIDPEKLADRAGEDLSFEVALYWTMWRSLAAKLRDTNDRIRSFFGGTTANRTERVHQPEPMPVTGDASAQRAILKDLGLSNMEINYLVTLSHIRPLQPGEALFREGDPGRAVYVVMDGRIMIAKDIPGAGLEALAFLERGEIFGELAVIEGTERSADAIADEETGSTVLVIPGEVLDKLLDFRRASSIRLLRVLCLQINDRLREANDKLVGWFLLSGGQEGTRKT